MKTENCVFIEDLCIRNSASYHLQYLRHRSQRSFAPISTTLNLPQNSMTPHTLNLSSLNNVNLRHGSVYSLRPCFWGVSLQFLLCVVRVSGSALWRGSKKAKNHWLYLWFWQLDGRSNDLHYQYIFGQYKRENDRKQFFLWIMDK